MKAARAAARSATVTVPKNEKGRFMVVIGGLVAVVAFLASVAGIIQLSGYSVREFLEKPGDFEVTVGSLLLKPDETVEVTCYIEAPLDENPVLCHIPCAFRNPWGKAAKNVRILFGCSSNLIHFSQPNETFMKALGPQYVKREPSRIGRHSTSAWTIERLGPSSGSLITESIVIDVPKEAVKDAANEELVVVMSIEADDFPRGEYTLNFRPAFIHETDRTTKLTRVSRTAHGEGVRRAEIILPNMRLTPFVDGTLSWGVANQADISYKAFDEKGKRLPIDSPLFYEAPPREPQWMGPTGE